MDKQVFEKLAAYQRNKEMVRAIISSSGKRRIPMFNEKSGKTEMKEVECVIFHLEGDVKGICPSFEFSDHEFRSLGGFVGSVQDVIILAIDEKENIAVVSVKRADEIKREKFWKTLKQLEKEGGDEAVQSKEFEGTITGYNLKTQTIFVKVEGQDCFMKRNDFDHEKVYNIADVAVRNKRIPVRVLRFKEDTGQVQVSRKLAIRDPFEDLREYEKMDRLLGTVSAVHPREGIFVKLENGVVIKASKPKTVEPPIVDDIVSLRIQHVDYENRKARAVILDYPLGKKKIKDITSFLYE